MSRLSSCRSELAGVILFAIIGIVPIALPPAKQAIEKVPAMGLNLGAREIERCDDTHRQSKN
jgi:hypothetical protein